jgi:adenylate cyclase
MEMRIGINFGDIIIKDGALYGDGVNVAARLEGLSDPGGICVSSAVHEQVQDKLDLNFEYMGEHEVKNIARPVRAYHVRADGMGEAPAPAEGSVPRRPSIAVLPFVNMSGDPEQDYFADGITEDLITEFSRFQEMIVIARNSMFRYKDQAVKVQDVGPISACATSWRAASARSASGCASPPSWSRPPPATTCGQNATTAS